MFRLFLFFVGGVSIIPGNEIKFSFYEKNITGSARSLRSIMLFCDMKILNCLLFCPNV